MKAIVGSLAALLLIVFACAPASQPAPAPAVPVAPKQPQAPAPAVPAAAPQPAPRPLVETSKPAEQKVAELKPKYGGHVVVPHGSDWPHFDPHLNISNTVHWRASLTYLRLLRAQAGKDVYDLQIVGDLADRWEISPDGLDWVFYLKKGVKWANVVPMNGRELTASDVVYSFERALSALNPARGKFDALKKVEARDKHTVKLTLKEKDARFMTILASDPAWIVPKEVVEKFGDLKNWGAGAGPFILERAQKSVGTFYRKNPDYFDADKIYVDYHDIPIIPDKATALAAFRAGKVDILGHRTINLDKGDLGNLQKTNPDIQWVGYVFPATSNQLWIRFGAEPFNDLRIRKAITHALDRDAMIKALFQGDGQWQAYVPSTYPGFVLPQEELRQHLKYDPALSKKLLAEAGFPKGFKTDIMWNKAGSSNIVELYQQFLKDIGVELDLQAYAVDYPRWVTDAYQGNYPQLAAVGGTSEGALEFIFAFNHTKGQRNGAKSAIPKVDELIERAISTFDVAEQQRLVQEVQRVLLTEVLWSVPCCETRNYEAWHPWVMNYRPYSTGILTRDHYWYIWLNK